MADNPWNVSESALRIIDHARFAGPRISSAGSGRRGRRRPEPDLFAARRHQT